MAEEQVAEACAAGFEQYPAGVELVDLASLLPDPRNARTHDRRNLEAIKASLSRYGQRKPIVVDADGVVRAGNGTLQAAQELGWTRIAVTRTQLRGEAAMAYAVADNRTSDLSAFDDAELAAVLEEIGRFDATLLEAVGFDRSELEHLTERFDVADAEMPALPSGERAPYQQMTFTLHDDQVELVKHAIRKVRPQVAVQDGNANGNALALIVEQWDSQSTL